MKLMTKNDIPMQISKRLMEINFLAKMCDDLPEDLRMAVNEVTNRYGYHQRLSRNGALRPHLQS